MEIAVGARVRIIPLNAFGKVAEVTYIENKVRNLSVVVGSFKIHCLPSEVEVLKGQTPKASTRKNLKSSFNYSIKVNKTPKKRLELDLHGLNVKEAITVLEKAINEGVLNRANSLKIIHGLGKGLLKSAVHSYLNSSEVISSFQVEPQNQGVTLAYFYQR
jgi:DNA mismatch repair protein MutS2